MGRKEEVEREREKGRERANARIVKLHIIACANQRTPLLPSMHFDDISIRATWLDHSIRKFHCLWLLIVFYCFVVHFISWLIESVQLCVTYVMNGMKFNMHHVCAIDFNLTCPYIHTLKQDAHLHFPKTNTLTIHGKWFTYWHCKWHKWNENCEWSTHEHE